MTIETKNIIALQSQLEDKELTVKGRAVIEIAIVNEKIIQNYEVQIQNYKEIIQDYERVATIRNKLIESQKETIEKQKLEIKMLSMENNAIG